MYDVIIVGARCAGASTAMLLARRGHRVLLLDRAAFPSDAISGHCILHPGTSKLAEWGLLDEVIASGCPPITRWYSDLGDFLLSAQVPTGSDIPSSIAPRRYVLDKILVDAAVAAGVELREEFVVTGLVRDGEQVDGIAGHGKGGATVTERARIVVGADGKRSRIAELVGAPSYLEQPTLTCWYYTYWGDFPCDGLELHWRHHRAVFALPTHGGLTMIAAGWPHSEFHRVRADIEGSYLAALRTMPSLGERLPEARRAERFYGMADLPNFFRRPYGAGWALVGDAGHHKDPMLARGISDAFCDAGLLADAIDEGLSGRTPLDESLASYERLRNERAIPDNEQNLNSAHLEDFDTPDVLRLRAALRGNPEAAGRFFAVAARVIPPEQFFNAENIGRIMRQARGQEPALAADAAR